MAPCRAVPCRAPLAEWPRCDCEPVDRSRVSLSGESDAPPASSAARVARVQSRRRRDATGHSSTRRDETSTARRPPSRSADGGAAGSRVQSNERSVGHSLALGPSECLNRGITGALFFERMNTAVQHTSDSSDTAYRIVLVLHDSRKYFQYLLYYIISIRMQRDSENWYFIQIHSKYKKNRRKHASNSVQ